MSSFLQHRGLVGTCKGVAASPRLCQKQSKVFKSKPSEGTRVNALTTASLAPYHKPTPTTTSRILPLLSELTAIQSINISFEQLAGRSAMLGFAVACLCESLLPSSSSGLFGAAFGDHANWSSTYLSFTLFLVTISVVLAASSTQRMGKQLLEAVIASLTSASRSSNSARSKVNVDFALDSAFDAVFDTAFMVRNFKITVGEEDAAES